LILYTGGQLYGVAEQGPSFQDDSTTFKWCREAVERCPVVPYVMAEMYRQGRGVTADPVSAFMWFMVAENVSSDICGKSRAAQEGLKSGITSQQLRDAQQRAGSWLKKAADQKNGKPLQDLPSPPKFPGLETPGFLHSVPLGRSDKKAGGPH
jgi:TPR repeat protein